MREPNGSSTEWKGKKKGQTRWARAKKEAKSSPCKKGIIRLLHATPETGKKKRGFTPLEKRGQATGQTKRKKKIAVVGARKKKKLERATELRGGRGSDPRSGQCEEGCGVFHHCQRGIVEKKNDNWGKKKGNTQSYSVRTQ